MLHFSICCCAVALFFTLSESIKKRVAKPERTHRFLPDPDADPTDWRTQLAQRYYKRLYREYALADLSRYKEGKVGLRWRTRQEVVDGKGQFICGSLRCDAREGLASFEVPFAYVEGGQAKQALVKVRVCARHAYKLNYKKLQSMERSARKEAKRARKEAKKRKREAGSDKEDEVEDKVAEADDDDAYFQALMNDLVQ